MTNNEMEYIAEIQEAIDRMTAKKPWYDPINSGFGLYRCPQCNGMLVRETNHCSNCGQKLEWTGVGIFGK